MSWINKINNIKLEVVTSDGNSFLPLWKIGTEYTQNFNVESFDFIGTRGTYVAGGDVPSGKQYPVTLIFQGEDHIEESAQFVESCASKDPLTVIHPLYGNFIAKVASIGVKNPDLNTSEVNCTFWETLENANPISTVAPRSQIVYYKSQLDTRTLADFTNKYEPDTKDIQPSKLGVSVISTKYSAIVGSTATLKDLTLTASGAADNLLDDPGEYMKSCQELINFPLFVEQSLSLKLQSLQKTLQDIYGVLGLDSFESQANTIITTACQISALETYETLVEVATVVDIISAMYNYTLAIYDNDGYVQDAEIARALDLIVQTTIISLYEVGANAKQERIIELEADTPLPIVANDYFGVGDENLTKCIEVNQLSVDEYFMLLKGREIKYYV